MEKKQSTINTLPTNESGAPLIQPSNGKEPKSTTIYDLPVEILLMIFQEIIESEALEIRESFPRYPHNLETVFNLVFVNKQWRDIVNRTSFLWRVFWFEFGQPMYRVQNKFDYLLPLAKDSPVDLFIVTIHSSVSMASHVYENCTCESGNNSFFTSLRHITNLRSLSLQIVLNDGPIHITLDVLPSLANLRYFHFDSYGGSDEVIDASDFLPLMPQLLELKLGGPLNQIKLEKLQHEKILLPRLRWLDLGSYTRVTPNGFASLLRQCPNIDYLYISSAGGIWERNESQFKRVTLHSLQTLHIQKSENLSRLSSAEWISTPNLTELVINNISLIRYHYCRSIFQQNPTIIKLTIPAMSSSTKLLCEAPTIQHLTLLAEESTGEDWLRQLANTEVESYLKDFKSPICPELRTLTILLGSNAPSRSAFKMFARSRCIPVNDERYTAKGYKALELLSVRVSRQQTTVIDVLLWIRERGAESEQIIDRENVEFRLRWSLARVDVAN